MKGSAKTNAQKTATLGKLRCQNRGKKSGISAMDNSIPTKGNIDHKGRIVPRFSPALSIIGAEAKAVNGSIPCNAKNSIKKTPERFAHGKAFSEDGFNRVCRENISLFANPDPAMRGFLFEEKGFASDKQIQFLPRGSGGRFPD